LENKGPLTFLLQWDVSVPEASFHAICKNLKQLTKLTVIVAVAFYTFWDSDMINVDFNQQLAMMIPVIPSALSMNQEIQV